MPTWFIRNHLRVLAAAAVAFAVSAALLIKPGLKHDYRLEAFIAGHDQTYQTFRGFMEEFSSNEVAVIAYRCEDAVAPAAFSMAQDLIDRVKRLEPVQNVAAVAAFPALVRGLLGESLYGHPLVADTLLSRDRRTAAIILQMAGEAGSEAQRRTAVDQLKAIVDQARSEHPEVEFHLAGPYVTLIDMYDYVDRDLLVFSLAAFVLLFITLALVFRRPGPMIYALAVSAGATVCTLGLSVALGIVASLITQMIVILLTVLSVAACVHLAVAVEEAGPGAPTPMNEGMASWRERAAAVLGWMNRPCTAMVTTTVVGFGSVCISSIAPIRSFGFLMSAGLMVSLAMSYAGCVLLVRFQRFSGGHLDHFAPHSAPFDKLRGRLVSPSNHRTPHSLARLGGWLCGHTRTVLLVSLVAAVVCALGMVRLRFESDFVKNFRPASAVRRGYEFVERNLSPVGSVEVVVRRRDGRPVVTPETVRRGQALAGEIVDLFPTIRKVLTLGDVLHDGVSPLPATQADLDGRLAWARMVFGDKVLRGFVNADRTAMRINLRAVEGVNVGEKLRIDDEIRRLTQDRFGPDHEVTVTGLYHFYAHLIAGLIRSQYLSFGLTLPGVFLLVWPVFRSAKMALLVMIPNLPPMVLCIGVMGWLGIPVNMTTAMMLSVSFGIAVDDAIHYLWRFRLEFARCGRYREAIVATHTSVGRACVIVTLTIAGGFWILVLSQFLPTAYFGALIGVTMAGALAADLLLLPVLILILRPFGPERVAPHSSLARHSPAEPAGAGD